MRANPIASGAESLRECRSVPDPSRIDISLLRCSLRCSRVENSRYKVTLLRYFVSESAQPPERAEEPFGPVSGAEEGEGEARAR